MLLLLLGLALANPIDNVIESISEEYGLTESSPIRLRPSTLRSKLELQPNNCDFKDFFAGNYSAGYWSGEIRGREAEGTYQNNLWGGVTSNGIPISDGVYASNEFQGYHGGSPVNGIYVRLKGKNGLFLGLTGCASLNVGAGGQSNMTGRLPGAPTGSTSPGLLITPSAPGGTDYESRVGPEVAFLEQGFTVVKRGHPGTSSTSWASGSQFLWGNLRDAAIEGNAPFSVFVFVQGESDAVTANGTAHTYADRVRIIFDRVEEEFGPQLFLWPRLHLPDRPGQTDYVVVNSQMEQLAIERDDLVLIDTYDLIKLDRLHYVWTHDPSMRELGSRLVAPLLPAEI